MFPPCSPAENADKKHRRCRRRGHAGSPRKQETYISGGHGIRADSPNAQASNDLGNVEVSRDATGAAIPPNSAPTDPILAEVVARWPALPEATRQAVLAVVREAIPKQ
jgi:hypothetical protein